MTRSTTRIPGSVAFLILFAASGLTLADTGGAPRTLAPAPVKVSYADLNLKSPEGLRTLHNRISAAAKEVCGPALGLWYPGQRDKWARCYRSTVDKTVEQMNVPELTALNRR
jgi:UrcA family protein